MTISPNEAKFRNPTLKELFKFILDKNRKGSADSFLLPKFYSVSCNSNSEKNATFLTANTCSRFRAMCFHSIYSQINRNFLNPLDVEKRHSQKGERMKLNLKLMLNLMIGLGVIGALVLTCDLQEETFFTAGQLAPQTQSLARQ
jgi:hypothetical protein